MLKKYKKLKNLISMIITTLLIASNFGGGITVKGAIEGLLIPANITATTTANTITITWDSVTGSAGYDIEADGIVIDNGSNTSYTQSGLQAGTIHVYRLRSKSEGVTSDWSSQISATTLTAKPDVPKNLTTASNISSITLTWDSVNEASGYDVEADGVVIDNGSSTTYTQSGLQAGTSHAYRVRSKGEGVTSDWSSQISATTSIALPDAPTNLVATTTDSSITLTWDSVKGATGYDVESDGVVLDNGTSTSYTQIGLLSGSSHAYRVRAKNNGGVGAWSSLINKSVQQALPSIPTNINSTITDHSITLTWDNVNGAIGYDVEADGVVLDNGTNTSCTQTGLLPGTSHTYRIRAKNDSGVGTWSSLVNKTVQQVSPSVPTNINSTATDHSITLTWDNVNSATGYDVEIDGSVIDNGVNTTYTQSGLQPSTNHTYRVRAKNVSESGNWSTLTNITTLQSVPKGSGTVTDPYMVYTAADLNNIRNNLAASYKLANDIDLAGVNFVPIGTPAAQFNGNFDGNGYSIQNLTINTLSNGYSGASGVGLFGNVLGNASNHVVIKNLKITVNAIDSNKGNTGALIGYANTYVDISNIYVEPVNSSSYIRTTSGNDIGGIVGNGSNYINISNCYSNLNVTGLDNAGGIVGYLYGTCSLSNSYFTGAVNGNSGVGGIVGWANTSTSETFTNDFVIGNVSGVSYVGGIIGCAYIGLGSETKNNYFVGTVNRSSGTGTLFDPLVGNHTVMANSYFEGNVYAKSNYIYDTPNNVNCRTTSQMVSNDLYSGWDFTSIWQIDQGISYPYLRGFAKPQQVVVNSINDFAGGSGTVGDPYLISAPQQLNNIRYNLSASYKLINNIDLSGMNFVPIGTPTVQFRGSFDGNGYSIRNLTINTSTNGYLGASGVGIFGNVLGSSTNHVVIKNVKITVNTIDSNKGNTGTLIGYANTYVDISNIYVEPVNSSSYIKTASGNDIGGIVGNGSSYINISNCYSNLNVAGLDYVGGIVGYLYGTCSLSNSYFTGTVNGNSGVGGIVGWANTSTSETFTNDFVIGNVSGISYVGGIIGCAYIGLGSETKNNYFVGTANRSSGTGTLFDPLVGNHTVMSNSYFDGNVYAQSNYVYDTPNNVNCRTSSQMVSQDLYSGWDFTNIWQIDQGASYPYLRAFAKPQQVVVNSINDFAGGSGTIGDPYLISAPQQLNNIRYNLSASYKLINNIDLSGMNFVPIGTPTAQFKGNFDGNGYSIRNLTINTATNGYLGASGVGLFGNALGSSTNHVVIKNAKITVNTIDSNKGNTGTLVGYANTYVDISNIYVEPVNSSSYIRTTSGNDIGGILGNGSSYINISNCYSNLNVTGSNNTGGIVGYLYGTCSLSNSYFTGTVNGNSGVGGIVGWANTSTSETFANDFVIGNVSGVSYVGGIVGCAYIGLGTATKNNYFVGTANRSSGTGTLFDPLVGNHSVMSNSYYDGDVYSASNTINSTSGNISKGRTTAQMSSQANFAGWDFISVWKIDEGYSYPYLIGMRKHVKVINTIKTPIEDGSANKNGTTQNTSFNIIVNSQTDMLISAMVNGTNVLNGAANIVVVNDKATLPIDLTKLTESANAIVISAANGYGKVSGNLVVNVIKDTIPPVTPVEDGTANKEGTSQNKDFNIIVNVETGASVFATTSGGIAFKGTSSVVSVNGKATFPIDLSKLVEGTNAITINAKDPVGNLSNDLVVNVIKDTIPPVKPTEDGSADKNGTSQDSKFEIIVNAETGSTVTATTSGGIALDGVTSVKAVNGKAVLLIDINKLTKGQNSITINATDSAGNVSEGLIVNVSKMNFIDTLVNFVLGEEFSVAITGENINSFDNNKFTIKYDANAIKVVDLCDYTQPLENKIAPIDESGSYKIPDGGITVLENIPGRIVFSVDNSIMNETSWDGIFEVIRFMPIKQNDTTTIKLVIQ